MENTLQDRKTAVKVVITPLSSITGLWSFLATTVHRLPGNSIPGDIVGLMKHSGIFVDGEFYEFTESGLARSSKGSPDAIALDRKDWTQQWHYFSRKPLEEFRTWIDEQNKFTKQTYDNADNNCHDFVTDACNLLQVSVPQEIEYIQRKCRDPEYRTWIQRFGSASLAASKGVAQGLWNQ